jgi:hypothetical protein
MVTERHTRLHRSEISAQSKPQQAFPKRCLKFTAGTVFTCCEASFDLCVRECPTANAVASAFANLVTTDLTSAVPNSGTPSKVRCARRSRPRDAGGRAPGND